MLFLPLLRGGITEKSLEIRVDVIPSHKTGAAAVGYCIQTGKLTT
jgi:hypothetical protein